VAIKKGLRKDESGKTIVRIGIKKKPEKGTALFVFLGNRKTATHPSATASGVGKVELAETEKRERGEQNKKKKNRKSQSIFV